MLRTELVDSNDNFAITSNNVSPNFVAHRVVFTNFQLNFHLINGTVFFLSVTVCAFSASCDSLLLASYRF